MPRPIALQLYTLREQAKTDPLSVLKSVAEIGYQGVELAGTYGKKPAEVKKWLDDLGLKITGAHLPVFDPAKAQEVLDEAQALGCKWVGGGFGPKQFVSEDLIREAAEKANAALERTAKTGLKIFYHNHWWEWDAPKKGELLFSLCPKLQAEFDIYWLQTAGKNPASVIAQYADRTAFLHVKDGPCIQDQPMTALGTGKVDLPAALAAGEKTPAEWYIVELDRCATDMLEAVRASYQYLVKKGLATGKK